MRDRLWIAAFWHEVLYPQIGLSGTGNSSDLLAHTVRRLFGSTLPDFVVAVCIDEFETQQPDHQRRIAAALLGGLHRYLARDERRLLGFAHARFLYFCGFFRFPQHGIDVSTSNLVERLEQVVATLREEHNTVVTMGVCSRASVMEELKQNPYGAFCRSAQQSVVALRRQLVQGKGQVGVYKQIRRNDSALVPRQVADKVRCTVRTGDLEQVAPVCAELTADLFGDTYIPLLKLRALLHTLVVTMALAAQAAEVQPELIYRLHRHYLERLLSPYDYSQLQETMAAALRDFTAAVARTRDREKENPAVRRAEAYIRRNLGRPLSLSVVAKAVGISAAYLSQLFRSCRGMTITQFINHERVEAAKALLLESGMTAAEVAFASGFGSVQHFNRVFRALTGCTPTQFRHLKSVHS